MAFVFEDKWVQIDLFLNGKLSRKNKLCNDIQVRKQGSNVLDK